MSPSLFPVPDSSDRAGWLGFAERLRAIGLTREFTLGRKKESERFPLAMRSDWLTHSYRGDSSPAAVALRLLALDRPVSREAAVEALGAEWFEFLVAKGAVVAMGDGWLSPFQLQLVNELYLIVDRTGVEPDTVMALGPTTEVLARASYPQSDIGSALDLGCGCGVLALLLARVASRVVGTDLNPRAVATAKLNAALNGVENVSFLEGDLFAPVEGERFDLIVAQPPFLACPEEDASVLFLHGGQRGDELTVRILEEMPGHLSEGGLGFVLADFGLGAGETVAGRLPTMGGVTVLSAANAVEVDVNAALYIANGQFLSGELLWQQTARQTAHYLACGVEQLMPAMLVVEAGGSGVRELSLAPGKWNEMERALIDRILGGLRGLEEPLEEWLPRQLRIVEGTRVLREEGLGGDGARQITLRSGSGSLLPEPVVGESVLPVICALHEADSVAEVVLGLPLEKVVPVLARLVLHGILRIV